MLFYGSFDNSSSMCGPLIFNVNNGNANANNGFRLARTNPWPEVPLSTETVPAPKTYLGASSILKKEKKEKAPRLYVMRHGAKESDGKI